MMYSLHFTIRERNLIHSSCTLVTEFNSSAIIPAITDIQNMMLLTDQAWTQRDVLLVFQFLSKLILNRRLFLLTPLGYNMCMAAKLVVYQED